MAHKKSSSRDTAYQFFRPFAFMTISGPSLSLYRLILPLILVFICCLAEIFLPSGIRLIGDKSLSEYMITFFSTLPGFFIAALAAVVAFNGGDLDNVMPDVKVNILANGDIVKQGITMRVFLSYLFSYLTIISFMGFFIAIIGSLISPSIISIIVHTKTAYIYSIEKYSFKLFYIGTIAFISSSIVFCTIQGLYFLSERVYQKLMLDDSNDTN